MENLCNENLEENDHEQAWLEIIDLLRSVDVSMTKVGCLSSAVAKFIETENDHGEVESLLARINSATSTILEELGSQSVLLNEEVIDILCDHHLPPEQPVEGRLQETTPFYCLAHDLRKVVMPSRFVRCPSR